MKEPLDHVARPLLPWRSTDAAITECGYNAASVRTISRDDFFSRLKEFGQQRAAMTVCMTCFSTAQRHKTWNENPGSALAREIDWEARQNWRHNENKPHRLDDELRAIERLISLHQKDFDLAIKQIAGRREWIAQKQARRIVEGE